MSNDSHSGEPAAIQNPALSTIKYPKPRYWAILFEKKQHIKKSRNMKKTSFILLTLAALLVCGCEKDPADTPGGNSSESTIDVTPYLGTYLMTRHTDLILTVATFNIPINRDLDVETITVKKDPAQEYGVIMTSSDGMYLRGTVDTTGLHLQNDTIRFSIDTLGVNASLMATLSHPVISAPVNGVMDWTSTASGTASATVPILGQLTGTITGNMHYRTALR